MSQRVFRDLGVLQAVEEARFHLQRIRFQKENAQFLNAHPEAALPPLPLLYEIGGRIRLSTFLEDGKSSATYLTGHAKTWLKTEPRSVLDWGCGVACVVRHLPDLLPAGSEVFGADYNSEMIEWARQVLPGIKFLKNDLLPPLSLDDNSLDWVYGLSVVTHLSETTLMAWLNEFSRVLRPGGLLTLTTNGTGCIDFFSPRERQEYENAGFVIRDGIAEGRKMYLAYHNPEYFRKILEPDWDVLAFTPRGMPFSGQDIWWLRAR